MPNSDEIFKAHANYRKQQPFALSVQDFTVDKII